MKSFARLTLVTAVASYLLVVLGGLVRASGAGLACPDWPLCHGRMVPPLEGLALIEYSHRLVASLVGVLTFAITLFAWRRFRMRQDLIWGATLALVLVGMQITLGGLTVRQQLNPWLVVAHLGTAMAFFAVVVALATWGLLGDTPGRLRFSPSFLPRITLMATFVLVLIGGYVSASGAGLACPDWPLCYGQVLPALTGPVTAHLLHRVMAGLVGLLVLATWMQAYRARARHPELLAASTIAVALLIIQVILGALNIQLRLATAVTTAHLATAAALFATLVVLVIFAARASGVEPVATALSSGPSRSRVERVVDYVSLTKPRIIILLLVTAFSSMLVAAPGLVPPWIILVTLIGGALSAASANAVNCLLDRDIDALMTRTQRRPLAARRVEPSFAFAFAAVLGIVAFVLLAVLVNLLSALLAIGALLFYVFVYTIWLKRSTPQNIVIGGAAGAVPPLVGWAAATGRVELPALVLFMIVFLWTPPHFWALALYRREDYALARIPMLPVVAGDEATRKQILIYSVVLVAATLLFYVLGAMGPLYGISAVVLGGVFVALAMQVRRQRTVAAAVRLFGYSILYLALLFGAMIADRMLHG